MLLLTLRGTPTCYYGDELGMQDVPIPRALMRDPKGKERVVTLTEQGQGLLLLSTHLDHEGSIALGEMHLRSNEGLLIEVEVPSLPR